jgi:hypothetical protein
MSHETVSMEEAMAARKVLIEVLRTQGLFPGPMPPTFMRNVGIDSEKADPRNHFIRVVLPVAEDVSGIPPKVNGVRIFVVQEDRRWIAKAL